MTSTKTDATCTSAQINHYKCENCDYAYDETVGSPIAHDLTGVSATLELKDGETCVYIEHYECNSCHDDVIGKEVTKHEKYTAEITTPATCQTEGVKTLTCAECGETKTEVISVDTTLGHKWDEGVLVGTNRTYTCQNEGCGQTKSVYDASGKTSTTVGSDTLKDELALKDANLDFSGIENNIEGNVTIGAGTLTDEDKENLQLSEEALGQVGDNPIYNFTMEDKNGVITKFEGGKVTITIPYQLEEGEDVDSIAIWYIEGDTLVAIPATYNNGYVTFETDHFSYYTVTRLTPAQRCATYGHNYRETAVEATCTEKGYTLKYCIRCGDSKKEYEAGAAPLGHDYQVVIKKATCTADGKTVNTCSRCTHSYEEIIPATGHTYDSGVITKAAGCTTEGIKTYTCISCSVHTRTEVIAPIGHSYNDGVVTAPTCTENGYTTYTCANCEHSYKGNYTDPTGHSYATVVTYPTCTEKGYTTYTCHCGSSYVGNYTEAFGHTWDDGIVTLVPTCVNKGVITYTCHCGGTMTEYIVALGHSYQATVTAPTCTSRGYTTHVCATCQDTYVDSYADVLNHTYSEEVTAPTCTEKGYTTYTCNCEYSYVGNYTEASGHAWDEGAVTTAPTCTKKGVKTYSCACGETKTEEVEALGHSYEKTVTDPTCTEKGYTTYTCSCGDTYKSDYVAAKGHEYNEVVTAPTCTERGYTTYTCDCGRSYVGNYEKALGHTWDEGAVTTAPTCTNKGVMTQTCACGETKTVAVAALGHSYEKTVTDPTCTEKGYTTYTCSCGDTYKSNYVAAKGHKYNKVETAPTCTERGYTTYTCDCGRSYVANYTDTIPHAWGAGTVTTAPTCTTKGVMTYACACGETKTTDIAARGHDYKSTVTAPTCTAKGYTTYACDCGRSYVANYENALGHTWNEGTVTTAPTCTEKGVMTYACACGETKTAEIAALGHSHAKEVTAPTCTERGYTTYTCSCGDTYKSDYVAARGHEYGEVATASTCTENGYTTYTCGVCQHSYQDNYTAPIGHKYSEEVTAPTCTAKGYTTYTCECGHSYIGNYTDAIDHSYVEEIVEATCDESGYTRHICSSCGDAYTDSFTPSLGHDYEAEWEWDDDYRHAKVRIRCKHGKCHHHNHPHEEYINAEVRGFDSTCDKKGRDEYHVHFEFGGKSFSDMREKERPESDHNYHDEYQYNKFNHWFKCSGCKGNSEKIPHEFDEGTVTKAATCVSKGEITYKCVCGYTKTEEIDKNDNHTPGREIYHNEAGHWYVCTRCHKECDFADHAWGEGKVTVEATCASVGAMTYRCACGEVKTEEIPINDNHNYSKVFSYDENGHWNECTLCGNASSVVEHSFGDWEVVVPATCTSTGTEKHDCSCGYSETLEITMIEHINVEKYDEANHWNECKMCGAVSGVEAHSYDHNTEIIEHPNCAEEGLAHVYCICGSYIEEVLEPTGEHSYKDGVCEDCGHINENACDHELKKVVVNFADLGYCGGGITYYACDCGEYTEYGDDLDVECENVEYLLNNQGADENGNIYAEAEMVCHDCGLHIYGHVVQTMENCESRYDFTYILYNEDGSEFFNISFVLTNEYHQTEVADVVGIADKTCGTEIYVYKCVDCGTVTRIAEVDEKCNFEVSEPEWVYDENKRPISYKQVATCPDCGLVETAIYSAEYFTPCHYIESQSLTFVINGELVFEYSTSNENINHEYEFTYELVGTHCSEGVRVTITCSKCGDSYTDMSYDHVVHGQEFNTSDYGICDGYGHIEICELCNEITNVSVHYTKCQFETISIDESGAEIRRCMVCGVERHSATIYSEKDEYCNFIVTYIDEFYMDGVLVLDASHIERHQMHNEQYTYELLGETCEDGYVVYVTCADCGNSYRYTSYEHRTHSEEFDLKELGFCGGTAYNEICDVCHERVRTEILQIDCSFDLVSHDEATNTYHFRCEGCGIDVYATETRSEKDRYCMYEVTYTTRYYKGDQLVIEIVYYNYFSEHNLETEYIFFGDSCDDGYEVQYRCRDCGMEYSDIRYDHGDIISEDRDLSDYGLCHGVAHTEVCTVCNKVVSSWIEDNCVWVDNAYTVTLPTDTPLSMFLAQNALGQILYLDGGVSSRYLTTTDDPALAVTMYAEKAGNGYSFYYILDGQKQYISLGYDIDGKTALSYSADSATAFSYRSDINSWVADLDGKEYFLGTYRNFNTLSPSRSSYVTPENTGVSQFPVEIAELTISSGHGTVCAVCGAEKRISEETQWIDSCTYAVIENVEYYKDGTHLFTHKNYSYYYEHNYETTYEMFGSSCDDGYRIINRCIYCGASHETHGWEHIIETESTSLSDHGMCGGFVHTEKCVICDEVIRTYVEDKCNWTSGGVDINAPGVNAPVENQAYIVKMYVATVDKMVYLNGGTERNYLSTTDDITKAVYMYAEARGDGYYAFYILVDGERQNIVLGTNDSGKTALYYSNSEITYFSYRADIDAWVTEYNGSECFIGSYNTFTNVSASNIRYITPENTGISQFPIEFIKAGEMSSDGIWTCSICGAEKHVINTINRIDSCRYEVIDKIEYYVNGSLVFEVSNISSFEEHNYDDISFERLGESCSDGYYVTNSCDCGEYYRVYSTSHDIYTLFEVDFENSNSCKHHTFYIMGCPCGENMSNIQFNQEGIEYDGGETYNRFYCPDCGFEILIEDVETVNGCVIETYGILTVTVDGTVVYTDSELYESIERHSYEGGVCQNCGIECSHEANRLDYIDLSDYGFCGGIAMYYTCDCGLVTETNISEDLFHVSCNNVLYTYDEGVNEDGTAWLMSGGECLDCGMYAEIYAIVESTACCQNMTGTYTFYTSKGGEVIVVYGFTHTQEEHGETEIIGINLGDKVCGGDFNIEICKDCGEAIYIGEPTLTCKLVEAGVEYIPVDGGYEYVQRLYCPDCGLEIIAKQYEYNNNCITTVGYRFEVYADGELVYVLDVNQSGHNHLFDKHYEYASDNCFDGVTIHIVCYGCGFEAEYVAYGHQETSYNYIDATTLGFCSGEVYAKVCAHCGELISIENLNLYGCIFEHVGFDEETGTEIQQCINCGVTKHYGRFETEKDENCKVHIIEVNKYYLNGELILDMSGEYTSQQHNDQVSYELVDTSCEDGYYEIHTCVDCGRVESYLNHGHYFVRENLLWSDLGVECGGWLERSVCRNCDYVDYSYGDPRCDMQHIGYDEATGADMYQCVNCGTVRYDRTLDTEYNGCWINYKSAREYYVNDVLVATVIDINTEENHNYYYEVEKMFGSSCTDGVVIIVRCDNCGNYTRNHVYDHTPIILTPVDVVGKGCGNHYFTMVECPCGEMANFDTNSDCLVLDPESTEEDMSMICNDCDFRIRVTSSVESNGCFVTTCGTLTVTIEGEVVYTYSASYEETNHSYVSEYVMNDDGSSIIFNVCERCGEGNVVEIQSATLEKHGKEYYYDLYFTPEEEGTYIIYGVSEEDTYVELYILDESGNLVSINSNNDCYNMNFYLAHYLESGVTYVYRIRYNRYRQSGTIPYVLTNDENIINCSGHNWNYYTTLLVEGGSCEDGVVRYGMCDCGHISSINVVYHHSAETETRREDLSGYGTCGGNITYMICACGQHEEAYINLDCYMEGLYESYIIDGITYQVSKNTCVNCGLVDATVTYYAANENCEYCCYQIRTLTIGDTELFRHEDVTVQGIRHTYVNSFVKNDNDFEITRVCQYCGDCVEIEVGIGYTKYDGNTGNSYYDLQFTPEESGNYLIYHAAYNYTTLVDLYRVLDDGSLELVASYAEIYNYFYLTSYLEAGETYVYRMSNYHNMSGVEIPYVITNNESTINCTNHYCPDGTIYVRADGFDGCEDGYVRFSICECGKVSEFLYSTSHNTYYKEDVNLNEYGVCGGYINFYECLCGQEERYDINVWCCNDQFENFYVDDNGIYHYVTVRSCSTCGLVYTYEYYDVMEACYTYRYYDVTIVVGETEVFADSYRNVVGEQHNYVATDFIMSGASCEDGVTVIMTCSGCGHSYETYTTSHEAFNTEYYDFTEYGACRGYYRAYSCACGYNQGVDVYDCSRKTVSNDTYVDENGVEHTITTYACPTCGLTRVRDRYYEVEGCYTYRIYTYTYSMNGEEICSYTERNQSSTHHSYSYTYEFADENNRNCEAGVTVRYTCADCGESGDYGYYTHHNTFLVEKYDFTDYGACQGFVEVRRCPCEYAEDRSVHYCYNMFQVSTDTYVDENGVEHTVEVYSCSTCGLVRTTDYYYEVEGCYTYIVNLHTFSMNNEDICSYPERYQVFSDHNYVVTYEFSDENYQNCASGVKRIYTCQDCGHSEYSYYYYHETHLVEEYNLTEYGACHGYANIYQCLCGESRYVDADYCGNRSYTQSRESYRDADGILHNVYVNTCPTCGITGIEDRYYASEGCHTYQYTSHTIRMNGEDICSYITMYYYAEHHNYSYTYEFADENNRSCEAGVTVSYVCEDCGANGSGYYAHHATFRTESYNFAEYGACYGQYYIERCACGENIGRYYDSCSMSLVSSNTYVDADGLEHTVEVEACSTCGLTRTRDYYFYDEGCDTYLVNFYTYSINGEDICSYDQESHYITHHNYVTTYEFIDENNQSCEYGVRWIYTCQDCEYSYYNDRYYHESTLVAEYDLTEYGACYGYVNYYECPCGYNTYVHTDYCGMYEVSRNTYRDADGIMHTVYENTCSTCGLTSVVDSYYASEGCNTYCYSVNTLSINGEEICSYSTKSHYLTHHNYTYTYEFEDESNRDCTAGVTVSYVCADCGDSRSHYYAHHARFYTESYSFAEYGACYGYLRIYSCACGYYRDINTDYCSMSHVSNDTYVDDNGVEHTVETNACSACGLTRIRDRYYQVEGCYTYRINVYTFSMNGEDIGSYSNKSHYSTHHNYSYTYEFVDENNRNCDAGVTANYVCADCGDSGIETYYGHNTYIVEAYDLTEYGACYGYINYYECICGYNTYMSANYCGMYEVSRDTYRDADGIMHYVYENACSTCGLAHTEDRYFAPEGCYTYQNSVYTLSMNGEDICSYTDKCHSVTHHNYTYTYEFADENNRNCEAGVTVSYVCADCGESGSGYYTHHYTFTTEAYSFAEYGACYGYLYKNSCACGYSQSRNYDYCNMSYVSNETYVDGDGVEHTVEVYTCSTCGLTRARDRYYQVEGCYTYRIYVYTFSMNGEDIGSYSEKSHSSTHHNYSYTYEFADENNRNCEAGVTANYVCVDCGISGSNYSTYHNQYRVYTADIVELGCCANHTFYYNVCPCGESYSYSYGSGTNYDSVTGTHYCYNHCGYAVNESKEVIVDGCMEYTVTTITLRVNEADIYSFSYTVDRVVHDFAILAELNEDGSYEVNMTCQNCGECVSTSAGTSISETVTLENHDGIYYYDYEFTPAESERYTIISSTSGDTYVHLYRVVNGEYYELSSNDDSAGNGNFKLSYNLEVGETYIYRIRFYYNTNAGDISFTLGTSHEVDGDPACESHNMKTVKVLAYNADSCEDGVFNITMCNCGRITNIVISKTHDTEFSERIEYCDNGYVEVYRCLCGAEGSMSLNNCVHGWSSNNNNYVDEDGIRWYVDSYYAPDNCGSGMRYDRKYYYTYDTENCTRTTHYIETIAFGDTLAAMTQRDVVETWHDYEVSYELQGTTCSDGVIITYQCRNCDYSYTNTTYSHTTFEIERFNARELGAECDGYIVITGCACGYERGINVQYADCTFDHYGTGGWIDDAMSTWQETAAGQNHFYSNFYVDTCAVTDPEQCGFAIRYAYYWLKNDDCSATYYLTVQLGYDEAKGDFVEERTYDLRSKTYHNYEDSEFSENNVSGSVHTCSDCGSYYSYLNYRNENGGDIKSEEIFVNTLDDGCAKYRENTWEYLGEIFNSYLGNPITGYYHKIVYADGSEYWDRYERSYEVIEAAFGENSFSRTAHYTGSNGTDYYQECGYTIYNGYEFVVYELRTEKDGSWYRWDYTYNFENGCERTYVYTDSNGGMSTGGPSSAHPDYGWIYTIKAPTCTQFGTKGRWCPVCEHTWDEYSVAPIAHNWVLLNNGIYYCYDCGLQNINGATGDMVMEDLTEKYGNGEAYVIGYWNRNNIQFTPYITIYLHEPMIVDGFEEYAFMLGTISKDKFHFVDDEYVGMYVYIEDINAAVAELCDMYGIVLTPDMYDVSISFVPDGADDNFDYAITFADLPGADDIDYVIHNSEFIVEYVAEGETVEFTICPEFSGYWNFEFYAGGYYGNMYVYDKNGHDVMNGGMSGYHQWSSVYLTAGEEYTVRFYMSSTSYENYVAFNFIQTIIDTPTTLYYYTDSWSNTYVYLWNWDEENGTRQYTPWPGYAMTPVDGMDGWYTATVDCNVDRDLYLIFTNGYQQTANLSYDGDAWWIWSDSYATFEEAQAAIAPTPIIEYYLRGSMNGWGVDDALVFDEEGNASITKYLYVGDEFKVANTSWSHEFNYGYVEGNECFTGAYSGGNIVVNVEGNYKITVTHDGQFTIELIAN